MKFIFSHYRFKKANMRTIEEMKEIILINNFIYMDFFLLI